MIEAYTLESLLKKYGIDTTKVINKNNNILEYGEYQDIDKTLNYLVKELHISARNIEKCPSIMYKAVNNIKENYEFLITTKINTGNIETTLHILNTNPKNLKETYNYVLNNYGIEYINRTTSILRTSIDRIKQLEEIFNDKSLVISAAISRNSMDEIKRIIKVCNKNNIPITSSVFLKTSEEIEKSIDYIKENYGQAYLTPLIISKNVEYLKIVLPYLESLGVLPYVIKSASILTLTLDEIKERKDFIESNNDTMVLQNGRFNSIFGLSRANYKKLTNKSNITKYPNNWCRVFCLKKDGKE